MQTQEQLSQFLHQKFKVLIHKVTIETKALWGTMDAQRMLEHLAMGFKIANGKIRIPESAIDVKSDKFKKLFLLSDRPLPRDFQNPIITAGLIPYEHESIEIAKLKLVEEINAFRDYFTIKADATCVHNLFGNLNYHEWLWFEYKHVMHHFMQFGIIPISDRIN